MQISCERAKEFAEEILGSLIDEISIAVEAERKAGIDLALSRTPDGATFAVDGKKSLTMKVYIWQDDAAKLKLIPSRTNKTNNPSEFEIEMRDGHFIYRPLCPYPAIELRDLNEDEFIRGLVEKARNRVFDVS